MISWECKAFWGIIIAVLDLAGLGVSYGKAGFASALARMPGGNCSALIDAEYIRKALRLLDVFTAHYGKIPESVEKEIKAIKHWCAEKVNSIRRPHVLGKG